VFVRVVWSEAFRRSGLGSGPATSDLHLWRRAWCPERNIVAIASALKIDPGELIKALRPDTDRGR